MATMVLMFGLVAISNMMIFATSSNSVANRASAATMLAGQELETLRSTPYSALADSPADALDVQAPGFFRVTTFQGVGTFETRWLVRALANPNQRFLHVRTEPRGFRGRWARAEFTTVRVCSTGPTTGCL